MSFPACRLRWMKQALVLTGSVVLIAIIGVTSYMLYANKETPKKEYVATAQSSSNAQQSQNQSSLPLQQQQPTQPSPQPTQQPSTGLQVQGDNTQQQSALPGPTEFIGYEQYAQSETPLIIDIQEGTGREVASGDTVAMLYAGYLTNGQLFDATSPNEQNEVTPFTFKKWVGISVQAPVLIYLIPPTLISSA